MDAGFQVAVAMAWVSAVIVASEQKARPQSACPPQFGVSAPESERSGYLLDIAGKAG
jgi:hypothetical protein